MSLPTSIYPEFKASPFFFGRVFVIAVLEVLKNVLPDIDWNARKTYLAPFEPLGLLSLEWARSNVQWTALMVAQGRPVARRGQGLQTATPLDWPNNATEVQIARAKGDHKHQCVLTDQLSAAKQSLMTLVLSESPDEFASAFRKLPVVQQTMFTFLTMVEAQYYEVPPDQIAMQLSQMHEPWVATDPPRVFTQRLLACKSAMSITYQASFGDVVLIQILVDALRHHPTLQQHVLEEFHRARPHDFENWTFAEAAVVWAKFVLLDKGVSNVYAATTQAPVQGPEIEPAVTATIGELTAAVHSLQATVHAMNTTAQGRGGGRGMQGRNYQAPQGRGNQGRAQQRGGAGNQGRGQGRVQGRGRGGNSDRLFCFWHHYNTTHATADCYYCNQYYPPASFPNVYTITRPGQVNAPGGVILVSGGGSNN